MRININTKPKKIIAAIFAVAIFAGFGLVGTPKASAEECICAKLQIIPGDPPITVKNYDPATKSDVSSPQACFDKCKNNKGFTEGFKFNNAAYENDGKGGFQTFKPSTFAPSVETNETIDNSCSGFINFFANPVNCTLIPILKLMGTLLSVAATIFGWIIDAEGLKAVLNNDIIYKMWTLVRDTLNIAFILVLLFSAFATVFQIEKFSYKTILKTLIIMAILVNFSFPIARVIIDFSNVLMYYFINSLPGFNANTLFTDMTSKTGLTTIIYPSVTADTTMLIAAIIFSFILAVTFIIIAILLVIRTVALAIIIIFSPIAFVGSIVPIFSKYSSQWWDSLFKYSFFGPIMIFMLYLSSEMMKSVNISGYEGPTLQQIAGSQSNDPGLIASMAFYAVPLVILWMGIGVAQKMSIAGASEVTGKGKKFMSWVGGKASGYNFMKSQYDSFSKSRKARRAEIESNRYGGSIGKWLNRKQDTALGVVSSSARDRVRDAERKEVQELRDKWKKNGGVSDAELNSNLNSKNYAKQKAAAMEMAEKNGFGDGTDRAADLARYQKALGAVKDDPAYKNIFDDKVKEKHIRLVIDHEMTPVGGGKTIAAAYKDNLDKLSAEKLSKQKNIFDRPEFYTAYMDNKYKTDEKFVVETAKKVDSKVRDDWRTTKKYAAI